MDGQTDMTFEIDFDCLVCYYHNVERLNDGLFVELSMKHVQYSVKLDLHFILSIYVCIEVVGSTKAYTAPIPIPLNEPLSFYGARQSALTWIPAKY